MIGDVGLVAIDGGCCWADFGWACLCGISGQHTSQASQGVTKWKESNPDRYCVLHPFNGEVVLRTEGAVVVRLLRSPSLRSNTEDCLARFIEAVTQRPKPMSIAAAGDKPPPLDLPKELQAWATEQGVTLSKAEADNALQRWLTEVRAQPSRDAHTLGLAAFVEKRYAEACSLFVHAAEERERRLESHLIQERKAIAESYRMAGDSEYNLQAFGGALIAYRSALDVYTRQDLPQKWARTYTNLGSVLLGQVHRASIESGALLLAQAVSAHRLALDVLTRKEHPQDWARTQNNLGRALSLQASWTHGEAGTALLTQAVSVYRSTLEVRTRRDFPIEWAHTQQQLGSALVGFASRAKVAAFMP